MAHVLIVDDEEATCHLLKEAFTFAGHTADVAYNGSEALDKLAEQTYDAMVLDLVMPGMSGEEVLKHHNEWGDMVVVVLTAHGTEEAAIHALRTRANDYVKKPIELMELVKLVERHMFILEVGPFRVDLHTHTSFYKGEPLENMTEGLLELLIVFMKSPRKFFTYQELVKILTGENMTREDATTYLAPQLSRLRRQVLDDAAGYEVIVTHRKLGFAWSNRVFRDQ